MTEASEGSHFPDEGMVDFDTELDDHSGDGPAPGVAPAGTLGDEAVDPKVAELTSDLQRLQAEYLNYKRRVDRDRELVLQNAKLSILSSLLPVLDAVDRAREHGELEGGFKAVAESLANVVESQGLHKFGTPGDEFDPRHHEALMHGHSPDVTTSTCQNIVQAGYQIGDRVVRPALVTVVDPEPGDTSEGERSDPVDEALGATKLDTEPGQDGSE